MNKFTKQCVAAVASLAMAGTLCVAGAVVAGSSAWAAQTAAEKAPWDTTLEANKKGSITIHKKDNTSGNSVGLNGATFTVKKVSKIGNENMYDLKTEDGWIKLAAKVNDLNQAIIDKKITEKVSMDNSFGTGGKMEETTKNVSNEDGVAEFKNLDIGLYYVEETGVPTGFTPEFNPFFVTVPQITRADATNKNTYTYSVSVEPKNRNAKNDVQKDALTGKIVGVGDTLPYKITAKVKLPATPIKVNNGNDFDAKNIIDFAIFDDALKSAYDDLEVNKIQADVNVGEYDTIKSELKSATSQKLEKNTDYTLTVVDTTNDATRSHILFAFNETGRGKITKKFAGDTNKDIRVIVTLNLKVKKDFGNSSNTSELINKYGFNPGHVPGGTTPDIHGNDNKTNFRKFHILKYNGTDTGQTKTKVLSGAQFKAFDNKTEADKCAKDPDTEANCSAALPGFADNGKKYMETNNQGKTNDYNAKVTSANSKIYVVEIKAPNGFIRSEQPHEVDTSSSGNSVVEVPIANLPDNKKDGGNDWFKLPKTGAAGVIIFALIGLGLVGSGMFVFLKNRKKEEEQQAA